MINRDKMDQGRINKILDRRLNYGEEGGGILTRREFVNRKIHSGATPEIQMERDVALTEKRKRDYEVALRRAGHSWGDECHPNTIDFRRIEADMKANLWVYKSVYTLGSHGSYYVITKTEYDYAIALIETAKEQNYD